MLGCIGLLVLVVLLNFLQLLNYFLRMWCPKLDTVISDNHGIGWNNDFTLLLMDSQSVVRMQLTWLTGQDIIFQ